MVSEQRATQGIPVERNPCAEMMQSDTLDSIIWAIGFVWAGVVLLASNLGYLVETRAWSVFFLEILVAETIAALDQFLEPLGKPRGWRAVNNVVVEAERHTQKLTDLHASVNDHWFLGNAAEGDSQC